MTDGLRDIVSNIVVQIMFDIVFYNFKLFRADNLPVGSVDATLVIKGFDESAEQGFFKELRGVDAINNRKLLRNC